MRDLLKAMAFALGLTLMAALMVIIPFVTYTLTGSENVAGLLTAAYIMFVLLTVFVWGQL